MKLLALLALVAFAGCQASVLRSDEPKLHFDAVKDKFWDYFAQATQTVQDTLKTIRESELGEQVNTKIGNSFKTVAEFYANIHSKQVSDIGQKSYDMLSEYVEPLLPRISEVMEWLLPHSEDLSARVKQQTEKLYREVDSYVQSWFAPLVK